MRRFKKKKTCPNTSSPPKNQTTVERILVVKQTRVINVRVDAFAQRHVHAIKRDSSAGIGGGPSQTYEIPKFIRRILCTFYLSNV